jgi:hypothetical protein
MREFTSPVGRLVQGSFALEAVNDYNTGKPKTNDDGTPVKECFIAVAFAKDDPNWPAFYGMIYDAARAEFPHLVGADGAITHPRFAFKIQNGDGVDNNGKSVADKPGFPGHWIVKMGTRYLPKCFHRGKYDPAQQIPNPNEVIKRGYYIRVVGTIRGNGVLPTDPKNVPGLFISPNIVEFVAYGDEIVGGPDAQKTLGATPIPDYLPPGASLTPMGGGAPAAPGIPAPSTGIPAPTAGIAPPPPAAPAVPAPTQAAAPIPPPPLPAPPAPTGPIHTMTPKAQGVSREQMIAAGWTDEAMIAQGYMIQS